MNGPLFNLKLQIEFMNKGIVPLGKTGAPIWNDVNKILSSLPADEARKMKRKFRKEWRKIIKRELSHGGKVGRRAAHDLGLSFPTPTRKNKNNRKQIVMQDISRKLRKSSAP